jgi:hypothetical protein
VTSATETGGRQTWRPPVIPARLAALMRREYGLFLLGIGAIVLHILDENFLPPQPGTSAGEHLTSGLVPIGIFAPWPATTLLPAPPLTAVIPLPALAVVWFLIFPIGCRCVRQVQRTVRTQSTRLLTSRSAPYSRVMPRARIYAGLGACVRKVSGASGGPAVPVDAHPSGAECRPRPLGSPPPKVDGTPNGAS